ncbi:MAG: helix-turn-helix domain-containing protein [Sporomusaceae bacterium]|nr:helix-turn-helix domain-containing protein [Sporomusaceae bacterium]
MRKLIMAAAVEELNENSIRFTMAELAKRLAVSKSTLYEHFLSKEDLIAAVVESLLDTVRQQDEVIINSGMTIQEKLKALLLTEPNMGGLVSSRFIFDLKRSMPDIWKKCDEYHEYSWKRVETLLSQGVADKYFRPIDLNIAKVIYRATIDKLLHENYLIQNNLTVLDTIKKAMDILYYGLAARETDPFLESDGRR